MTNVFISIILILLAIVVFVGSFKVHIDHRLFVRLGSLIPLFVGIISLGIGCIYTQDIGEVIITRNWDGALINSTDSPGLHFKSPLETTISYDTRNMLINFYTDKDYSYDGGSATGPQVTINDKSGAKADIDIQVVYSLNPSSAMKLYADYGTQTNYTASYLSNDVRSVAREISGQFDTITMLTDRAKYTDAVEASLAEKWEANGLHVEQVSVQEVRYPEAITDKYAQAQAAEIARSQAINERETAKVEAETKKINAQAEADANDIINRSLSDNLIQQHYIDALIDIGKNGNLVVVPEGSQPIVGSGKITSE